MARAANNGGKDSSGSIISSKASFAHARSIVDNKSSNVLVTHFVLDFLRFLQASQSRWCSSLSDASFRFSPCFYTFRLLSSCLHPIHVSIFGHVFVTWHRSQNLRETLELSFFHCDMSCKTLPYMVLCIFKKYIEKGT